MMQNFCHALKLNVLKELTLSKCKQLFDEQVARTKDSYKDDYNFLQQRILCLILPASVK